MSNGSALVYMASVAAWQVPLGQIRIFSEAAAIVGPVSVRCRPGAINDHLVSATRHASSTWN